METVVRKLTKNYRTWLVESDTVSKVLEAAAEKARALEDDGFFVENGALNTVITESDQTMFTMTLTVLEI